MDQAYQVAGLAQELLRLNREETQPLVHAFLKTSRGPRRLARLHCLAFEGAQADATGVCRAVSRRQASPRFLGKETYSGFDMNEFRRLMPIQNGSRAFRIANACCPLLGAASPSPPVPVGAAPGDASKGRSQPYGGAS